MSDKNIGYTIAWDHDQIKIKLESVEGCESLLGDMEALSITIAELIQMRKDSLIRIEVNGNKYVEWWNEVIVPKLLDMKLSEDDLNWKWGQLMKQEFRMWICSDKPVSIDEVNWLVSRRGFNEMQKEVLIEGLGMLGLYDEFPIKFTDVDGDCAKKMEVIEDMIG